MNNIIYDYFSHYSGTVEGFEKFHNEVINMPRPTFREIPQIIKLLKSLASYVLLFDSEILSEPMNAKDVYKNLYFNYKKGILPADDFRNRQFEETFLDHEGNFDDLYVELGRRFRHYTELFTFFGIFKKVYRENGRISDSAIFDKDFLEELVLTDEKNLFDVFRNNLLDLNVNANGHVGSMQGIKLENDADYRPARAILRYMADISRRVTDFEISVLLGRVDGVQNEKEILKRAEDIGRILPQTREEQETFFFKSLKWENTDGERFHYASSQQPDFKFKTFLILMDTFHLISYDNPTKTAVLTEYSKKLLAEEIPFEVADLQNLLSLIDDETENSNKLASIILRTRNSTITKAIQEDGILVEKLNIRNIHHPIIKNNKRMRNRLIMEVAKIKANYLDEVTQSTTFEGRNGHNYVEAHHIIEFNGENGPDITENLICLGPQNHSLIHHGSANALEDFYNTCKSRSVITFGRFKNICVKYRCLTKEHVKTLLAKKLISSIDAQELNELINQYGVDPVFMNSLQITAESDSAPI